MSNKALTENIYKRTNKVYGIAHKAFTNCLILDADDPTRQDAWVLMEFLEFKSIKYKAFDSGKGVHIWTFWENLQLVTMKILRICSYDSESMHPCHSVPDKAQVRKRNRKVAKRKTENVRKTVQDNQLIDAV